MKKQLKTTSCLVLMILMSLTMLMPSVSLAKEDASSNDWMSKISDDTYLSSVSIPGTHDSASEYCSLSYLTSCQDSSIAEQLEAGYRYLDIRLMLNDSQDGFILNHGGFKCRKGFWPWSAKLTYDDIVSDTYSFLDSNPSETVIYAIKIEKSDDDVATCERLIQDTINANPDKWYVNNTIPTLGEARGKIVLAARYDDVLSVGEEHRGLNFIWEDQNNTEVAELPYTQSMINDTQSLWVQDRFKYTEEDKISAFEEGIDNCLASDDTFFINFLSLSGQAPLSLNHPKGHANSLNKQFMEISLESGTCYGIIVLDRADKDKATKIYTTNF